MIEFKSSLWEHQQKAVEQAKNKPNFGLFFEVGTGKTRTAIKIMCDKMAAKGRILKTLIVAPPIVLENWRREILQNTNAAPTLVTKLVGSGSKRLDTFVNKRRAHNAFICIINYESLIMPKVHEALMQWCPEILIFDESHKLKDATTKRAKAAIKLADKTAYKLILSGTPVLNSPMDLFGQYRVLDGGESFGQIFTIFRSHYFYDKNASLPPTKYFPNWALKSGAEKAFNDTILRTAAIAKKSECLDLPPLIKKKVLVELSPEQKKHYKELKNDLITYLNNEHSCVAPIALTKALRLQQIVSGFVVGEDLEGGAKTFHLKENPRADALKDMLEELTPRHKVIVWAVFKNNYQTIKEICHKLSLEYVELTGDITPHKKQENVDIFNNNSKTRVLIGHPMSGGIGVNLIASDVSIYYSRNFSLEAHLQSEARNYRGGSEIHEKIVHIDLVAEATIDEHVLTALESKQRISDTLLRKVEL